MPQLVYSRVLNTTGGLNDWGGGNIFWKLISEGVLFNKGVGNSCVLLPLFIVSYFSRCTVQFFIIFQLIFFTQFLQSIFLFQCVLPSFSTIKCAISHDNCTEKASVKVNRSCVLYSLQDLLTYKINLKMQMQYNSIFSNRRLETWIQCSGFFSTNRQYMQNTR